MKRFGIWFALWMSAVATVPGWAQGLSGPGMIIAPDQPVSVEAALVHPCLLSGPSIAFSFASGEGYGQGAVLRLIPGVKKHPGPGGLWRSETNLPERCAIGTCIHFFEYRIVRFEGPDLIFPHYYSW